MKFENLSRDYRRGCLSETDWPKNPMQSLTLWVQEAIDADLPEPNAMTLATADARGRPSARIVLLRHLTDDQIGFVTNYESRKGQELAENPFGALVFHWQPLERQVRLEGPIVRAEASLSDALFAARPRESRLGAWASNQSGQLESREELLERLEDAKRRFPDDVPRPEHWGAFLMVPAAVEFWQGRPFRLHDRLRHQRDDLEWTVHRLSP